MTFGIRFHDAPAEAPSDDRPSTPRGLWLGRRRLTWGSSEVAPLLLAYGLAPLDAKVAGWQRECAEHYARLGIPKLIAWKAGLAEQPKGDEKSKEEGNRRERQILTRWQFTSAHEHVDPRTVEHSDVLPRQMLPIVDRNCAAIAVSPDAWAHGYGPADSRELVAVEIKSTRDEVTEAPWGYVMQTQSQMDAMHATRGLIVMGIRWLREDLDDSERYLATFIVRQNDHATAMRYAVATEALTLVAEIATFEAAITTTGMDDKEKRHSLKRRKAAAANVAELWEASKERMSAWRDPSRDHIDDALAGIDDGELDEILSAQSA